MSKPSSSNSQSFLAHYYFAATALRESPSAERSAQVEASLRTAIKLNPEFAPAFEQLADFYGMQHRNLEEAVMLNLTAIELEPSNINFRMNRANLMMERERPADAIAVLQGAMKLTDKPEEIQMLQSRLQSVQEYQAYLERQPREHREDTEKAAAFEQSSVEEKETAPAEPKHPELTRRGPRRTVRGTLMNVQCSYPATMTLKVEGGRSPLGLRAANYYKVEYTASNFKPDAELNPCKDLEGMKAKVEYFEGLGEAAEGQIISIELSK